MKWWIAEYLCLRCSHIWMEEAGPVSCPSCGNIWIKWLNFDRLRKGIT